MANVRFSGAGTRFHQQDGPDQCGDAVAQMILGFLGPGIPPQDQLRGDVNRRRAEIGPTNDSGLHPDEVCFLLNKHRPCHEAAFNVHFDTREDAVRRVFTSLLEPRPISVATSILGGTHWVAVSAVAYDADSAPDEPEILGFFIDNPEPPTSGRPLPGSDLDVPQPHTANDTCGHGRGTGSAKTFVTLHEWLSFYWATPFNTQNNTFVTISQDSTGRLRGSLARESTSAAPGKQPSTPAELCRLAMEGIDRYALSGPDTPFESKLIDSICILDLIVQAARPSDIPSLQSSEPFYIVIVRADEGVTAHVRIGAKDSRFLSVETPATFLPLPEDLFEFASSALERHEAEDGLLTESFPIGERCFTVHPNLVWCPCTQSMSPFQPFVQINFAGRMVFVSMDGRIHSRLNEHPGLSM